MNFEKLKHIKVTPENYDGGHLYFTDCDVIEIEGLTLDGGWTDKPVIGCINPKSVTITDTTIMNTYDDGLKLSPNNGDVIEKVVCNRVMFKNIKPNKNSHSDGIQCYADKMPKPNITYFEMMGCEFDNVYPQLFTDIDVWEAYITGNKTRNCGDFILSIYHSAMVRHNTFGTGMRVTAKDGKVMLYDNVISNMTLYGKAENFVSLGNVVNRKWDSLKISETDNLILGSRISLLALLDDDLKLKDASKYQAGYNFYQSTEPIAPDESPVIIPVDEPDNIIIPRAELESMIENINRWLDSQ